MPQARNRPARMPSAVGPYHLEKPLGRGGAGTVYKSLNRLTGMPVAVKLLDANLLSDSRRQYRFAQEFQAASKLDHPNIVRALDFGMDGGQGYLVMEYVDGETLGDLIDRTGRLPEADAVRIIMQVAQGLGYAHRRKIIHRDVKPDNILIRKDGQVKLTDFGLAKDLTSARHVTQAATALGTPHFMAPEQYENAKNATPASDIYALAATLYTALTGTVPFDSVQSLLSLAKKLSDEPPSVRAVVPAVSEHVDAAVRRGLNADPLKRPNSCLKFCRLVAGEGLFVGGRKSEALKVRGSDRVERRASARLRRSHGTVCVILNGSMSRKPDENDEWSAVVSDVSTTGVGLLMGRRFEKGTQMLVPLERTDGRTTERWVEVVRVIRDAYGHWFHGCSLLTPLSDAELDDLTRR